MLGARRIPDGEPCVWIPKYRRRVLNLGVRVYVRKLLGLVLAELPDCRLNELNIREDHIHLLVAIRQRYAVSAAVGRMKGQTTSRLREKSAWLADVYWAVHVAGSTCLDGGCGRGIGTQVRAVAGTPGFRSSGACVLMSATGVPVGIYFRYRPAARRMPSSEARALLTQVTSRSSGFASAEYVQQESAR